MNRRGPKEQAKADKNTYISFVRLLSYLFKYYKIHFLCVCVFIVISALANVQGTYFLQSLIDDYIAPFIGTGSLDTSALLSALTRVGSIYLIGVICTYSYSRIMVTVSQGTLKHMRDDMFEHMQSLSISYFDSHTHGELMSRYTNDIDALRQMLGQTLPQIINSAVTIISVFISMLTLSIPLTIINLCFTSLMVVFSRKAASMSSKYFTKQQESLGNLNGYIEEMMDGQRVVKVFCYEEEAEKKFDRLNEELCENSSLANQYSNIIGPISNNLGHFTYSAIAMIGSIFAINGISGLTLGGLASFLQFTKSFNNPISQITQQFNNIVLALAGAKRIFDLLDQESEVDDGIVTLVNVKEENGELVECDEVTNTWAWRHPHPDGSIELVKLQGDVRFDHTDFGYVENKIVLHDINLFAKPGEKVAFVGATGAGKTTITNLINRFYDIQHGMITYDGIDIKLIKKNDLRHSLGMVLQDTHLFTGTIADNIRYGKLDATDEEVVAAAKLANADQFIRHLPQGYKTVITNDGESLSQGQRQLLSIARAALNNPPVLILDEATSSIDTRTEALVQDGMDSLMEGRTVFVIAHRLSTVRNSDVIMVLDHGVIIERGSHDQLIEQKGTYYQLYTGAFELS